MRIISIYKAVEKNVPPTPEQMAKMGQLMEELTKSGVLVAVGGCMPSATGARVRMSGGKLTVTDGPFTEAKEVVAGFGIYQVNSKEEAIELSKRFLKLAGDGETELRQMYDEP